MQRRGGRGQHVKGRPKVRKVPTASITDLQEQLDGRTRDLEEALQRETATSEVLRVISSSPSYLKPVFETILANATRLCGATAARTLPVEKRDVYLQRIAAMLTMRGRGHFTDGDVSDVTQLALAGLIQQTAARTDRLVLSHSNSA